MPPLYSSWACWRCTYQHDGDDAKELACIACKAPCGLPSPISNTASLSCWNCTSPPTAPEVQQPICAMRGATRGVHDMPLAGTQEERIQLFESKSLRSPEEPPKQFLEGLLVRVHVYDVSLKKRIQKINRVFAHKKSPLKFGGVFHAGVEVNGLEWCFGFEDSDSRSGICCMEPKTHPQHHYRQTVEMGRAQLKPEDIADILADLVEEYPGSDYDLLRRNCCHFASDFTKRLGVGSIPGWINRAAKVGAGARYLVKMVRGQPKSV
eukprot:TRINITY_DN20327_c0_g1_i1.p1 TRINITY_DN20327_c0_g1~~TRINITY_DN20327_c0_g1_i1.p1  ORF type:complete len:265 (-),score=31.29 TRINITY_DN20327_c0_g1_i1:453-1247(-)